ncbi:MAG: HD domain-containing protein, partial [bacterium]
VNAGLLHDLIEWTDNPEKIIKDDFGEEVYNIVLANTKNREIEDPAETQRDYVNRCAEVGKDALIVKSADTLDSYQYYSTVKYDKGIERSRVIARLILNKVENDTDPIFNKLREML